MTAVMVLQYWDTITFVRDRCLFGIGNIILIDVRMFTAVFPPFKLITLFKGIVNIHQLEGKL